MSNSQKIEVSKLKGLIYGAMYGKGEYPDWWSMTRNYLNK